ncbi:MAG TPA: dihydrodipicolinate synthase family protein [Candidatus Corynebacterium avicola]|uniref:Dihydrodipicolinate synthase family protein n=1 Tax=Candidatus Corynebacterium avicola TaxID=2838527 RepID=A0A9D1RRW7_9CORY|nr:dihydrodipicolinate synthase family protein [Candidatus Corynebacterium avicola]
MTLQNTSALVDATGINNGLVHTPVTPFNDDETIDYDTLGKVLDFHQGQQPGAIALHLDAGERYSLRDDERKELVEFAVKRVVPTPVLVDVTVPGTAVAASLASHAQQAGAAGVIVTTPYFYRPPEDMLVEHFRQIAAATDLAVLLYSSPRTNKGGVGITQPMVEELIDLSPNVVGFIDGSLSWPNFMWLRKATLEKNPSFVMLPDAEYLSTSMTIGADGALSPLSAIIPGALGELYALCRDQRFNEARSLQQRVGQVSLLVRNTGASLPASIKAAMEILGRPTGTTRGPNLPLGAEETERLRAGLTELNVIGTEPEGW